MEEVEAVVVEEVVVGKGVGSEGGEEDGGREGVVEERSLVGFASSLERCS